MLNMILLLTIFQSITFIIVRIEVYVLNEWILKEKEHQTLDSQQFASGVD